MPQAKFLSDKELRDSIPALAATAPVKEASKQYEFVPTQTIVKDLATLGWLPVEARQTPTRLKDNLHAKHVIRFRQKDQKLVNGVYPEAVWMNSHDRSFRAVLAMGFFRTICSNGLIVAEPGLQANIVVTKHIGFEFKDLEQKIKSMTVDFNQYHEKIADAKKVKLSQNEKVAFAMKGMKFRFDKKSPITPSQVLEPRRDEDKGDDLWTVFNVVQENLIKGGLKYKNAKGTMKTTRGVTSVYWDKRINQELWMLMEGIRLAKKASN